MTIIKDPMLLDNVFNDDDIEKLLDLVKNPKIFGIQEEFSRWVTDHETTPELQDYADKLIPLARSIFESNTLLPTFTLFVHYEGDKANLKKHKDTNACTYTIDLCLYQNKAWDIYVEGKPYTLNPNQALAFYGNDQEHWRENFPDNNQIGLIFFNFAEPDHWWFKEGKDYPFRNNLKGSGTDIDKLIDWVESIKQNRRNK